MLHDVGGGLHAHIAEVPGLVDNAGHILLAVRVADDKAVFLAVLAHPLVHGGVFQTAVLGLVIAVGDVAGETGLVLAGARGRNNGLGHFLAVLGHLTVIQILLGGIVPVAGGQVYAQAFRSGSGNKFLHRLDDAGVQRLALQRLGGGCVLADGIVQIGQDVFPAGDVDLRQVTVYRLGGLFRHFALHWLLRNGRTLLRGGGRRGRLHRRGALHRGLVQLQALGGRYKAHIGTESKSNKQYQSENNADDSFCTHNKPPGKYWRFCGITGYNSIAGPAGQLNFYEENQLYL